MPGRHGDHFGHMSGGELEARSVLPHPAESNAATQLAERSPPTRNRSMEGCR